MQYQFQSVQLLGPSLDHERLGGRGRVCLAIMAPQRSRSTGQQPLIRVGGETGPRWPGPALGAVQKVPVPRAVSYREIPAPSPTFALIRRRPHAPARLAFANGPLEVNFDVKPSSGIRSETLSRVIFPTGSRYIRNNFTGLWPAPFTK